MPNGIIINSIALGLGGIIGSLFGKNIPCRIKEFLTKLFGITSITIGISLIGRMNSLPSVMLALILGSIVGEGFRFEDRLKLISTRAKNLNRYLSIKDSMDDEKFIEKYVGVLILVCAGSTGLMGAMTEAITNDSSILITKAVLDFFSGIIFASTMGISISLISIPLFIIYGLLYLLSGLILPYTTQYMIGDFMACGGVIAIVTGFRIAEIKSMNASSLLPSLAFIMPISWLWINIMG